MSRFETELVTFLTVIAGTVVTIFWMVVGWRAMRAHEKLAATLSRGKPRSGPGTQRQTMAAEGLFREFLKTDPIAKHLDADEQLRRFAEWKANAER
jgi:hypothetical protein